MQEIKYRCRISLLNTQNQNESKRNQRNYLKIKKDICDHVINQQAKWSNIIKFEKITSLRVLPKNIKN